MRAFSHANAKTQRSAAPRCCVTAHAQHQGRQHRQHSGAAAAAGGTAAAALVAMALHAAPALAVQNTRLPPIDNDPNRCERAYTGNTIGQANAVSDKVLDLRQCKYGGKDLSGKVLSGAYMSDADFTNTTMRETVMTKAYAVGSNFEGADMTNAVIDRVDFRNTILKGVRFSNAVVTGAYFEGADLTGADFEGALIGGEDAKRLCGNPTAKGETRVGIGCRPDKK